IANEYYLLKKYSMASNYYLKSLNSNNDYYHINSYITFLLVKSYYEMKKYNKAILIGESFSIKYNLIRELYFILSECYKMLEELDISKEYFKTYLSSTQNEYSYYFSLMSDSSKNLIPEFFGFSVSNLEINN
nr:glycosyl transferase [Clostridium sp. AL.422]